MTGLAAPEPLVVVGGGEHASVVADAARASGRFHVVGFVDPHGSAAAASALGAPWLGDDRWLAEHPGTLAVLGVGSLGPGDRRARIVERLTSLVGAWAAVVHPRAVVAASATLAPGAVVMAGAVVQPNARLGAHCVVNTAAVVEHDCVVGDYAQLAPRAALGGGAIVGAGAFVGLGALVRDHRRVGAGALVAMGAVVVGDVADGARVAGVPARALASPAAPALHSRSS